MAEPTMTEPTYHVTRTYSGTIVADAATGEILAVVSPRLDPAELARILATAPALPERVSNDEQPELLPA